MMPDANVINAAPSKRFFIEMLTRDISLLECILDLIDNSIHSVLATESIDVMESLLGKRTRKLDAKVAIDFAEDRVEIRDTCGGIPIDDARDEVFRFGVSTHSGKAAGLGVYGIGMKRAFFKLGRDIVVDSVTHDEEFRVHIPVDDWADDNKPWTLAFDYARPRSVSASKRQAGTHIKITQLNEEIRAHLDLSGFSNELSRRIGATYGLFLQNGLQIAVNGRRVKADLPKLTERTDQLRTVRQLLHEDGVDILIIVGMTPKEDETSRGWYIFCNGRMVIERDQTSLTGWGDDLPAFHPKYNHFFGYVYFRSKDPYKLPWKTTKDGVTAESRVYQRALAEMKLLARPVLNFFNNMYPGEVQPEGVAERELLERARPVSLFDVAKRQNTTFQASPRKSPQDNLVNIQYRRSKHLVEKAKKLISKPKMSNGAVGEYTFDLFMRREG